VINIKTNRYSKALRLKNMLQYGTLKLHAKGEIMYQFLVSFIFTRFTVGREIKKLDKQEKALLIYFLHAKYKKRKIRLYKDAANRLIAKGILVVVESEVKRGNKLVKISDKYLPALKKYL